MNRLTTVALTITAALAVTQPVSAHTPSGTDPGCELDSHTTQVITRPNGKWRTIQRVREVCDDGSVIVTVTRSAWQQPAPAGASGV